MRGVRAYTYVLFLRRSALDMLDLLYPGDEWSKANQTHDLWNRVVVRRGKMPDHEMPLLSRSSPKIFLMRERWQRI
jgi:hypothetical protein